MLRYISLIVRRQLLLLIVQIAHAGGTNYARAFVRATPSFDRDEVCVLYEAAISIRNALLTNSDYLLKPAVVG